MLEHDQVQRRSDRFAAVRWPPIPSGVKRPRAGWCCRNITEMHGGLEMGRGRHVAPYSAHNLPNVPLFTYVNFGDNHSKKQEEEEEV